MVVCVNGRLRRMALTACSVPRECRGIPAQIDAISITGFGDQTPLATHDIAVMYAVRRLQSARLPVCVRGDLDDDWQLYISNEYERNH